VGFQGANYRYADDGADVSKGPDRAAARGEGGGEGGGEEGGEEEGGNVFAHTSAYVSIRQHTSAYVSRGEEGGGNVFARWSQGAAPWTDVVQLGFVAFHSSVHADGARDCGLAGMLTYADVC
jgi:hypothetical protein